MAAVNLSMDDFTNALMLALHAGADDPARSAMGSRMKALVAELSDKKAPKTKQAAAAKELAKVREAYRIQLLAD
ncbi:MAG: hypothetical protein EBT99_05615 [Betaproteobacteria bacterium]|nr:hypothetical protein [Betaproteobacteria bacterium]